MLNMPIAADLTGQKFGRLTVIELYGRNKHKKKIWLCKCECGSSVDIEHTNLTMGNSKSCGCYNIEKIRERSSKPLSVGDRFGKLRIVEYAGRNSGNNLYKCVCKCGKEVVLQRQRITNAKSCGSRICSSVDISGKRFGMLVAIKFEYSDYKAEHFWSFKCDCGNDKYIGRKGAITRRKNPDCGCVRSAQRYKLIEHGTRYSSLRVLCVLKSYKKGARTGNVRYLCKCVCGRYKIYRGGQLKQRTATSCGCWSRHVNGSPTSAPQRKIAKYFPNSVLNLPVGRFYIDIALVEEKFAIEFDCWYWHRKFNNTEKRERRKDANLMEKGWKIIRIRSGNEIPIKEKLMDAIKLNLPYMEIVFDEWTQNLSLPY